MSNLNIKLQNFEGPFDLLLHLIKKNKMNIYDIKIYDITNQYKEYLESMKENGSRTYLGIYSYGSYTFGNKVKDALTQA